MYIPSHFCLPEADAFRLMEEHSFATLVSTHEGRPYATHLPLQINAEERIIRGHMARANPQWEDLEGQEVLAIFLAEHHYISPTWYATEGEVPTWNYAAVHVYGNVRIVKDPKELSAMLAALIERNESSDSNYGLAHLDAQYVDGLMRGIVGFEIEITKIEGKAKMSQNHPEENRRGVIEALRADTGDSALAVADRMERMLDYS